MADKVHDIGSQKVRVNFEEPREAARALMSRVHETNTIIGTPELEITLEDLAHNQTCIMLMLAGLANSQAKMKEKAQKGNGVVGVRTMPLVGRRPS